MARRASGGLAIADATHAVIRASLDGLAHAMTYVGGRLGAETLLMRGGEIAATGKP